MAQTSKKAVTKKTTKAPTVKQGTGLVATVTNVLIAAHPKVLTVDALVKSSGTPRAKVLMYHGSISRTLKLADQLGRLKK